MQKKFISHLISLCPSLYDPNGHGPSYHEAVGDAAHHLGLEHHLYACGDWLLSKPNWHHYFKKDSSFLARFLEFASLFRKSDQKRIFFIESFQAVDYCALILATLLFLRHPDVLWVLFRYGRPQYHWQGLIHTFLFRVLKKIKRDQVIALTDSDQIAKSFAPAIKMELMPIPHTLHRNHVEAEKDQLTCWWPGQPRVAKGLPEIQKLLHTQEEVSDIQLIFSEELTEKTHIPHILQKKVLSREEYVEMLSISDVILLPYDPHTYRYGTSGIFVEAIMAGKMPLVKEGSWLAQELLKHSLPELIVNWGHPHFFANLRDLFKNREVADKLALMQQAYAKFHSVEGFAKSVTRLHTDCS